jgi:tetratricopeptide (TPR) repeat protein
MDRGVFSTTGAAEWHSCRIETPSAELVFAGAELFADYWISAAKGTYFESGNPSSDTVQFLDRAVQQNPNNLRSNRLLGTIGLRAKQYQAAARGFGRLLELGYDEFDEFDKTGRRPTGTACRLADAYLSMGDYNRAIDICTMLIKKTEPPMRHTVRFGEGWGKRICLAEGYRMPTML